MPCYFPWIKNKNTGGASRPLSCGQCIGCRLKRSREWATRCVHEKQMHKESSYITLTYDDDHVPNPPVLKHKHFQDFIKRLRSKYPEKNIRYYMSGEYGTKNGRPHYHACLFGIDFDDRILERKSTSGFNVYTSYTLAQVWGLGFASTADVTFESAAYIARYLVARVTGPTAKKHYTKLDPMTNTWYEQKPEYNKMSLRPALGKKWLEKYKSDVYPHGFVIINAHKAQAPRYYDDQYKKTNKIKYNQMKKKRETEARKNPTENTNARLEARETVHTQQANQLKRGKV